MIRDYEPMDFFFFTKNMNKDIDKNIDKELRSKYSQKVLDNAEQPSTYALKTTSNREIQENSRTNW